VIVELMVSYLAVENEPQFVQAVLQASWK